MKTKPTKQPLYCTMTVMPLLQYVISKSNMDPKARKAINDWDAAREKLKRVSK